MFKLIMGISLVLVYAFYVLTNKKENDIGDFERKDGK